MGMMNPLASDQKPVNANADQYNTLGISRPQDDPNDPNKSDDQTIMPLAKAAKGGVMKAATRNALPAGKFGLPSQRKYPVNDKPHARAAKSRDSEELNKGVISPAQKSQIDAAANRELRAAKGGVMPNSAFGASMSGMKSGDTSSRMGRSMRGTKPMMARGGGIGIKRPSAKGC